MSQSIAIVFTLHFGEWSAENAQNGGDGDDSEVLCGGSFGQHVKGVATPDMPDLFSQI
jgi:hypothetical protein